MARQHPETGHVQPIAVRRPEAAAALGVSVETFDGHVRPHLPALRLGGVTVYAVADLEEFAARHADRAPAEQLTAARRRRTAA